MAGEERVVLAGPGGVAAQGLWSSGRAADGIHPWADLAVGDLAVLPAIAGRLEPGSALMVAYGNDATERALRRRVPPAATPLGFALIDAGCRWLKDWSFAEGGREGTTKLQGNLPLDEAHARRGARRLADELIGFLATTDGSQEDRALAAMSLDRLRADPGDGPAR
jgi:hypothetical protein